MKRIKGISLKLRVLLAALPMVVTGICSNGVYAAEGGAEDKFYEEYVYESSDFDPLDCAPLLQYEEDAEDSSTGNNGSNAPLAVPDSEYYFWSNFGKSKQTMIAEYEAVVKEILSGIKSYWTDEQKLFYLHDYIVLNAEYDYEQLNYQNKPISQSAYGNLVLHTSVCDGYARAFYDLANRAGVETYDVLGPTMNHAWNLVKLDGKFYYVDCTWDDAFHMENVVQHSNFLVSQDRLAIDHNGTDWQLIPYYNVGLSKSQIIYGKYNNKKYDNACWKNSTSKVQLYNGYSVYFDDNCLYKYYGNPNQSDPLAEVPGYNGVLVESGDDIIVTDNESIYVYDSDKNAFIDVYVAKEKYLDNGSKYYYKTNVTSSQNGYLYFDLRRYEYGKTYSGLSDDVVRSGRIDLSKKESYFAPVYDETYFLNTLGAKGITYQLSQNSFYIRKEVGPYYYSSTYGSPLEFFIKEGMMQGYKGSERFDLDAYKRNNPDLVNHYGDNNQEYYFHYLDNGKYEKRVAKPDSVGPEGTVLMHRMYNPNSGEHFYTGDILERTNLILAGWTYEGDAWFSPESNDKPVYRLYNPNAGDHHYTLDANERDSLVKVGWIYEKVAWYSASKETGKPVYRLYNPNAVTGSHHYTTKEEERDALITVGWRDEGIGWYAE